jgi:hypothetical protein
MNMEKKNSPETLIKFYQFHFDTSVIQPDDGYFGAAEKCGYNLQ